MAMAMAACSSCSRSSGALRGLGEFQAGFRCWGRGGGRRSGDFCVGGNAISRRCGEAFERKDWVVIRAAVGGDGGEDELERPRTMSSSKKRPKTMSSVVERPPSRSSLSEKRAGPREKVRNLNPISALMDDLAGLMAPREKGDIRDVILMSFSFAVLIYISQHIVHAYFALRHTLQPFPHF